MSLKSRINNYAKSNHIAAQVVLQNYMFECFLARLSESAYSEKFVIKGGMLIAAIVGLDTRSTMDLDTTLRDLPLTEKQIAEAFNEICKIEMPDDVMFKIQSIMLIRKNDIYGGYRVRLDAIYDTIITPLSIDISTGDVITPEAVKYEFSGIFDEGLRIRLWGYNIETVMAEKVETILSRGVFTTRPRDFYDIYILGTTQKFDKKLFKMALKATELHRGSLAQINDTAKTLKQISESPEMRDRWRKYQNKFVYAKDITYDDTIEALRLLV